MNIDNNENNISNYDIYDESTTYYAENILNNFAQSSINECLKNSSFGSFTNTNQFIKYSSFDGYGLKIYNDEYKNIKLNRNINISLEYYNNEAFLLIIYDWAINYHHMMWDMLPFIIIYKRLLIKNTNIKLLLPINMYYSYVKEILNAFDISNDNILCCKLNYGYKIKKLYVPSNRQDYNYIYYLNIEFWKQIKKHIFEKLQLSNINIDNKNIVYLTPIETSYSRKLINTQKIEQLLNEKYSNVHIYKYFSKNSIYKKSELLSNTNILITQMGASSLNILFGNNLKHIIFLYSDKYGDHGYDKVLNHDDFESKSSIYHIRGKQINNSHHPLTADFIIEPSIITNLIDQILNIY